MRYLYHGLLKAITHLGVFIHSGVLRRAHECLIELYDLYESTPYDIIGVFATVLNVQYIQRHQWNGE